PTALLILSYPHRPLTNFSSSLLTHPPTTEIYTLSLHDALPILIEGIIPECTGFIYDENIAKKTAMGELLCKNLSLKDTCSKEYGDRKSTRLNSSHVSISYAVFCLKKKKNKIRYSNNQCKIAKEQ